MSTTDLAPAQPGALASPELPGSYEELDLDVIRQPSRTLRIHGHAYPVPPALTVPMMAELLELEQSIREASRDPEPPAEGASEAQLLAYEHLVGENRRRAVGAINRAHQAIEDLLQAETPGVRIQLDVNEIMLVIRWLVQNRNGASGAAVAAITDAGGSGTPDSDEEDGEATPPGGEEGGPLASGKPSSRRSSGSATSRSGRRAGGARATGTTSESPSATRDAA